jgi:hypothetical protein
LRAGLEPRDRAAYDARVDWPRLRITGAAAVAVAAALAPAGVAVASGGVTGSIKIVVPKHIKVGNGYSIELTGHTSHRKSSVILYAQRTKCAKQVSKVPRNAGYVFGGVVTGQFKLKDHFNYAEASHGAITYCAYLYYAVPPSYRSATIARTSTKYKIPS